MTPPDKVALVTGAGTGIGRAAALSLNRIGYAVVLAGRRTALLEETAAMAGPDAPAMLAVPCDISQPAEIAALFGRAAEAFGRLDLLFNNAGRQPARRPLRGPLPRRLAARGRRQPHRGVPLRAGSGAADEAANAEGRADRQ